MDKYLGQKSKSFQTLLQLFCSVYVLTALLASSVGLAQNNFNQIENSNIQELLPEVQSWNAQQAENSPNNTNNLLGNFENPEDSDDVDFVDEDLGDQNIFGNDNSNLNADNPFESEQSNFALDGIDETDTAQNTQENALFDNPANDIELNANTTSQSANNYVDLNTQAVNNYVDLNNQSSNSFDTVGIQLPEGVKINQNSGLFRGAKRPGTRRILAPGEAPFEYIVKPGDTLQNICDQLIDDPKFWPKLWSVNPQIHNPHFIRPGMKLRFYPGTGTPGAVARNHGKTTGRIAAVPPAAYADLNNAPFSDIKAPPPAEEPKTDHTFEPAEIIKYIGREVFDGPTRLRIPSFITKTFDKKHIYGKAVGGIEGQFIRSSRELVLIKPSKEVKPGMSVTFIRKDKLPFQTHKLSGRKVYNYAQHGEIVAKAGDSELYIVRIDPGHGDVETGDLVVPFRGNYREIKPKIDKSKRTSFEDMYVIYFGSSIATQGGQGQFVYFDKGTEAGVKVGQQLEISSGYGRQSSPDTKSRYPANKVYSSKTVWTPSIAIAEIIDVAPDSSVGFLLYSTREVMLGDKVSSPNQMDQNKKM